MSKEGVASHYKNDKMDGIIAPTDSRYRNDVRLQEEGNFDEADKASVEIANIQHERFK